MIDARREERVMHQSEPGEYEIEELVEHLDVDPEFAEEGVGGAVDVVEVDYAVDGGEEGAVEPAPALGDEFGDLEVKWALVIGVAPWLRNILDQARR
jgi:hypothetical protein